MPAAMAPEEPDHLTAFGDAGRRSGRAQSAMADGEAGAVVGDQGAADLDDEPAGLTDSVLVGLRGFVVIKSSSNPSVGRCQSGCRFWALSRFCGGRFGSSVGGGLLRLFFVEDVLDGEDDLQVAAGG